MSTNIDNINERFMEMCGKVAGRWRTILGSSPKEMDVPIKVDEELYFEGKTRGNVLLRKRQYEIAAEESESLKIARNMIIGKVYNARWVIERTTRDHPLQADVEKLKTVSERMNDIVNIG